MKIHEFALRREGKIRAANKWKIWYFRYYITPFWKWDIVKPGSDDKNNSEDKDEVEIDDDKPDDKEEKEIK